MGNRKRAVSILVVEDETLVRDTYELVIKHANTKWKNIEVILHLAEDYEEGMEKLFSVSPDILICDIDIPGGCGLTILEEARKHTRAVTIVVSQLPVGEWGAAVLGSGAHTYVSKREVLELGKQLEFLDGTLKKLVVDTVLDLTSGSAHASDVAPFGKKFAIGDITYFYGAAHYFDQSGRKVRLYAFQRVILQFFCRWPHATIRKELVVNELMTPRDRVTSRRLRAAIADLQAKIGPSFHVEPADAVGGFNLVTKVRLLG